MKKKTKPSKKHAPLVVGNWKMNPESIGLAKKIFIAIRKHVSRKKLITDVAIAPPAPYLSELERLSPSQRVKLVSQDVFCEKSGAYTGELSIPILKSVGVSGVIIGHSERRALGDSKEDIAKNVEAALKSGLTAILCVGEAKRDVHGNYFSFIEEQLISALDAVSKNKLNQLVIAYEPIWAIGTGDTATAEDVQEMKLFITKVLVDRFGRSPANKIRLLYGGSVKAKNAEELISVGEVDGFLVGGASLKADEFVSIIKTVETYAKS